MEQELTVTVEDEGLDGIDELVGILKRLSGRSDDTVSVHPVAAASAADAYGDIAAGESMDGSGDEWGRQ